MLIIKSLEFARHKWAAADVLVEESLTGRSIQTFIQYPGRIFHDGSITEDAAAFFTDKIVGRFRAKYPSIKVNAEHIYLQLTNWN